MDNKFNPADFVTAAQLDGIAGAVQAQIDRYKHEGRTVISERCLMPAFHDAFVAWVEDDIDMTDADADRYGKHDHIKYYVFEIKWHVWEKVKPKLVGADI